jgi:malonate decarboxylase beta subunit
MRATLDARAAGVPVIALIGSGNGAFGGMGIVARCCTRSSCPRKAAVAVRPEVIETVRGVEEFDSRDRALVWRVTGGKHRYLIDQAQVLVPDAIEAFAQAASDALQPDTSSTDPDTALAALQERHAALKARVRAWGDCRDGLEIWAPLGIAPPSACRCSTPMSSSSPPPTGACHEHAVADPARCPVPHGHAIAVNDRC